MQNADPNESLLKSQSIGWEVTLSSIALGLTSLVTQVILLREFLSVFFGNELVIGILLANWMLLTGIGSFAGKRLTQVPSSTGFLIPLLALLGTLPLLTVILLRLLRNVVFSTGSMIGIIPIIGTSFTLLIPYCLLSGVAFTVLASLASGDDRDKVSGVYVREATGSIVGGIVFTLVLVLFLNAIQCLTAVMAIDLATSLALSRGRPKVRAIVWILSAAVLIPALAIDIDRGTKRFLYPGQDILYSKDTPFGNLTVTEQSGQLNFYENNALLSSTNDATGREEAVHYAMVQHPSPKSVLLIGGAISGATDEILKYEVDKVTYVEVNPTIIDVTKRFTHTLSDSRITTVNEDAPLFVRGTRGRYDVVLLNTPEPATMQANRYYTAEFFGHMKSKMNPGAILSVGLLPATDYQSDEARQINSTMSNTLRSLFGEVLIVPGLRTYFLASDSILQIAVGKLVEFRGINNAYVNRYYLDDEDLARRSALIQSSLTGDAPINRDFEPVSYYRQMEHWLTYFRSSIWIVGGLVAVLLLLVAKRWNAISVGVFTGGFAASSIEVLLLLAFQILYGYVYQVLGIIVTVFMAGMAGGAFFCPRLFPSPTRGTYAAVQTAIATFCFVLPLLLLWMRNIQDIPIVVQTTIFLLTFVLAFLVGLEFAIATRLRSGSVRNVASELYGVDLIGSALGALLVGTYLVPVFGFFSTSVIAGLLSLMSAATLFTFRRGHRIRAR